MSVRVHPFYLPALFFVLGVACIFFSWHAPLKDFGNYYYGSKLLLDGRFSSQIYTDIAWFNRQIVSYGESDFFENYIPVPPFSAVFYIPFCLLNSLQAKLLFNVISLLLICFSIYRVQRFLNLNSRLLYLVPFLFLSPLYNNLLQGQSYLLLCAAMLEIYMALEKRQVPLTSFLGALVIALKLFPGMILLYFLFRKELKTFLYTAGSTLLLVLVTLLILPGDTVSYYYIHVVPRLINNDVIGAFHPVNQSSYSALLNLFCYDALANPAPLAHSPLLVVLGESLVISVLLMILAGMRTAPSFLFFGFVLFSTLLFSRYHASYSALFILPLCLALPGRIKNSQLLVLFGILVLLVNFPAGGSEIFLLQFKRLWGLLLLLVFFILFMQRKLPFKLLPLFFIPLCVLRYLSFPIKPAEYFPVQNTKGILYETALHGDSITLKSTLGDNEYTECFFLNGAARTDNHLVLDKNRLYYKGKLVSASTDNKASPFLYKDSLIVFMSDLNQAVRFYKLRTLALPKD